MTHENDKVRFPVEYSRTLSFVRRDGMIYVTVNVDGEGVGQIIGTLYPNHIQQLKAWLVKDGS